MTAPPEARYARNGPIHLTYHVLGSGPPNLLAVKSGPNAHVDHDRMEPPPARFCAGWRRSPGVPGPWEVLAVAS